MTEPYADLVFDFDPTDDDARLLAGALAFAGCPCSVRRPATHTLRVSHPSGSVVTTAVEWFRARGWSCGRGDVDPD